MIIMYDTFMRLIINISYKIISKILGATSVPWKDPMTNVNPKLFIFKDIFK